MPEITATNVHQVPVDKEMIRLIHDLARVGLEAPDDLRAVIIETIKLMNSPTIIVR